MGQVVQLSIDSLIFSFFSFFLCFSFLYLFFVCLSFSLFSFLPFLLSLSCPADASIFSKVNVSEGDNITLACSNYSYPQDAIAWKREDGDEVESKTRNLKDGHLMIWDTTVTDAGNYICTINTGSTQLEHNINVQVLGKWDTSLL